MTRYNKFIKTQINYIRMTGYSGLLFKSGKICNILAELILKPFYHLAVSLNINWANAYYYVGQKHKKKCIALLKQDVGAEATATILGDQAINCFRKACTLKQDWLEAHEELWKMYFGLRREDKFIELMPMIAALREEKIKAYQLDRLDIEFVPSYLIYGSIGIYENLDACIKAGILGLRSNRKLVFLLDPDKKVVNPCYLKYWSRWITIISNPVTILRLSAIEKLLTLPLGFMMHLNDRTYCSQTALGVVQKKWYAEKRSPLLSLKKEDYDRGWSCLESFGMPRDAWFVCLHVREFGYNDGHSTQSAFRNADISTYMQAIEGIVDRGGWVIRIGDPTMTKLPKMDQVIDYAHSDKKSDWMDVFCCAQCRFFIGTSSGMLTLSTAFGVPIAATNFLQAVALYSFKDNDIVMPKLCWNLREKRELTFQELMSPPVSYAQSQREYDKLDLEVIENTPEEIRDLIVEMLDQTNGELKYTQEDECLQERFRSLTVKCGILHGVEDFGINARIGRDFLCKHSSLLPDVDVGKEEEIKRYLPS